MTTKFNPLPAPGDFVWCHFPETLGCPGIKSRPALVTAVFDDDHAVRVVYGTSQKTDKIYPGEFVLDPSDPGFQESGLAARTKFDLGRHETLTFSTDWFTPNQSIYALSPLPKMGSLHSSYMAELKKALSRIS